MESPENRDHKDHRVHQELQDPTDNLDQEVIVGNQDRMVSQAHLEVRDSAEKQDNRVPQV